MWGQSYAMMAPGGLSLLEEVYKNMLKLFLASERDKEILEKVFIEHPSYNLR
jgi:hypothetical protein